jgi:hypothetical protein
MANKIEEVRPDFWIKQNKVGGWRRVYPIKKDMNRPFGKGNVNWLNFLIGGSWGNFMFILFVIIIVLLGVYGYTRDTGLCKQIQTDKVFASSWCVNFTNAQIRSGGGYPNLSDLKGGNETFTFNIPQNYGP